MAVKKITTRMLTCPVLCTCRFWGGRVAFCESARQYSISDVAALESKSEVSRIPAALYSLRVNFLACHRSI